MVDMAANMAIKPFFSVENLMKQQNVVLKKKTLSCSQTPHEYKKKTLEVLILQVYQQLLLNTIKFIFSQIVIAH